MSAKAFRALQAENERLKKEADNYNNLLNYLLGFYKEEAPRIYTGFIHWKHMGMPQPNKMTDEQREVMNIFHNAPNPKSNTP